MGYTEFILTINSSCITILIILAIILLVATRFRGENGYAAAIIVLPNVPVYIYNMSRMLGWHEITLFMFPISYSVNTMLMPLLWLFTLRNFDTDFRFRPIQLLHFIPAAVSVIIVLSLSTQERMDNIIYEMSGDDMWVGNLNALIILFQMFLYFAAIFRYLHKKRHYIKENWSDAEYLQKEWIPKLMYLFAALFVIVMTCYVIWPRTDAWLIQILNVIAMSYLTYNSIAHPAVLSTTEEVSATENNSGNTPSPVLDEIQMQEICKRVTEYLETTQAFLRNDLSLAMLSKETGIPQKMLSRAVNSYMKCNFFELINAMRVEKARQLLLSPETSGYTIDSIYEECGFRSRSTFFLAFKKAEGKSPAQWLKSQKNETF